jgi:hypothetical protein
VDDDTDTDGSGGGGGGSGYGPLTGANLIVGGGSGGSTDGSAAIYWMTATTLSPAVGASVTLTSHLPTTEYDNTETFTVGTTTLCSVLVAADGTATCTTSALPAGTDDVTATDTDDAGAYKDTTEVLALTVGAAAPTATPTAAPVPASGAVGSDGSGGVPLAALLLIILGCAGIVNTRRHRRAH